MKDFAEKANLVSGYKGSELKDMIDNRTHEPQPQIYSVKAIAVPETPDVLLSSTPRAHYFIPNDVRNQIANGSSIFTHLRIPIEVV